MNDETNQCCNALETSWISEGATNEIPEEFTVDQAEECGPDSVCGNLSLRNTVLGWIRTNTSSQSEVPRVLMPDKVAHTMQGSEKKMKESRREASLLETEKERSSRRVENLECNALKATRAQLRKGVKKGR